MLSWADEGKNSKKEGKMELRTATRYHDFSAGHRVSGHENKCAHLHGHNYRVHFTVEGDLDDVGRVMDFGEIGRRLCNWLEDNWDHKILIWTADPWLRELQLIDPAGVQIVPFNPTAENMAEFLVSTVGKQVLEGTGVQLIKCCVEETRKCSATFELHKDAGDFSLNENLSDSRNLY